MVRNEDAPEILKGPSAQVPVQPRVENVALVAVLGPVSLKGGPGGVGSAPRAGLLEQFSRTKPTKSTTIAGRPRRAATGEASPPLPFERGQPRWNRTLKRVMGRDPSGGEAARRRSTFRVTAGREQL
jgi:hypothetical protein